MNRKRLFALVLSVLMVLTLVPALGEEAAADAVGWDTSVEDEIIVTVINGYYTAGEQKLAEEYMALHPETKVTIDVIADQTETGEPLCPAPTVELEGKTLVEDVDYTVSYEDNVEEGTAMLVVAGIGNCTGQQHATFEILEGPEEDQEQQSDLMAALPFVAGPAAVAAVALGIVMVTLFRRKPAK